MASSKDTYESHTWRANTFAAGAWRGVGVTVTVNNYAVRAREIYQSGVVVGQVYQAGSVVSEVGIAGQSIGEVAT